MSIQSGRERYQRRHPKPVSDDDGHDVEHQFDPNASGVGQGEATFAARRGNVSAQAAVKNARERAAKQVHDAEVAELGRRGVEVLERLERQWADEGR
jgi:hypothetical protein